jgi:hypothetical protein
MKPLRIDTSSRKTYFNGTRQIKVLEKTNTLRNWIAETVDRKTDLEKIAGTDLHLMYWMSDSSGSSTEFSVVTQMDKHTIIVKTDQYNRKLFVDGVLIEK